MRTTRFGNRFEAPSRFDPANYALNMERIARRIENEFYDLEFWSNHMGGTTAGSAGKPQQEVGSPAIVRERTADQTGFNINVEKSVLWNNSIYDNTATFPAANTELVLPDQNQRYWWYMGANLLMPEASSNARYTTRLYVQDFDPGSGQLLSGTYRYNQYMIATGSQFIMFDGLFRSGGGRARVTMTHNSTGGSLSVLAGSSVWAVRVCPAR